jgi:hypothetical protein
MCRSCRSPLAILPSRARFATLSCSAYGPAQTSCPGARHNVARPWRVVRPVRPDIESRQRDASGLTRDCSNRLFDVGFDKIRSPRPYLTRPARPPAGEYMRTIQFHIFASGPRRNLDLQPLPIPHPIRHRGHLESRVTLPMLDTPPVTAGTSRIENPPNSMRHCVFRVICGAILGCITRRHQCFT